MTTQDYDFTGTWHCRYWYPNTKHDNREELSEYLVQVDQNNNGYSFHSLNNRGESEGSYLQGRFTVDNGVATGTWLENTSPIGDWQGMTYRGAFQMIKDKENDKIWNGMWVGTGYNNNNPKVFADRWEMSQNETELS